MDLLQVLERNNVELRSDIKTALSASSDQFNNTQEDKMMKPQLLFAVKWATTSLPNTDGDDHVVRMGWASKLDKKKRNNKRSSISQKKQVGMFVLTKTKLCFVRTSSSPEEGEGDDIQVYAIDEIFDIHVSGLLGRPKKLSFSFAASPEERKRVNWGRLHKGNAKYIKAMLVKNDEAAFEEMSDMFESGFMALDGVSGEFNTSNSSRPASALMNEGKEFSSSPLKEEKTAQQPREEQSEEELETLEEGVSDDDEEEGLQALHEASKEVEEEAALEGGASDDEALSEEEGVCIHYKR
mmetsp:Transcript_6107/g.9705  ORF Transcript_6107/g.9705 Transcript_6107/m.9705 type:complete len:296 (-) Transcript_6107:247-1134(-)|eukprot:CAMPEP_0194198934 /NCGR_PEP_ID=MMETSP0156-20130528/144_1 /TAXON_ID=33649 /ORGANISM="Thalassionema nitzschioides, Strain L26-B" /LENGTH=295 /DNA_ID=CAMNT_0038923767 /DNA_START=63 /DNA_END=950 /DNA_ORIENTATION=+